MKDIKERWSEFLGLNYDEIKAEGFRNCQQLNPDLLIDEDTWREIWYEIEQIFKEYAEKENISEDKFMINFCDRIDDFSSGET